MSDQPVPEYVARWAELLEEYFPGKSYNDEQARQIKRWAVRHSERVLKHVYQSVVAEEEFKPLVSTLKSHVERVYEGYPELAPFSYNRQVATDARQITDDAGFTQEELDANFARLREVVGMAAGARRFE